jgi:hypothetical protein
MIEKQQNAPIGIALVGAFATIAGIGEIVVALMAFWLTSPARG